MIDPYPLNGYTFKTTTQIFTNNNTDVIVGKSEINGILESAFRSVRTKDSDKIITTIFWETFGLYPKKGEYRSEELA